MLNLIKQLSSPLLPEPVEIAVRPPDNQTARAVIFDVYGTMFISAAGDVGPDSAGDDDIAFRLALLDAGWSKDEIDPDMRGAAVLREEINSGRALSMQQGVSHPEVNIVEVWQRVLRRLGVRALSDERAALCAVSYECRVNPVWPMPGLRQTLNDLQRAGKSMGILSNAQFYTPLLFKALLGEEPEQLGFASRYCRWSYREGKGKPELELFKDLRNRLLADGIEPSETLYVGNDMLKDIYPARQVGWRTVLFAGDARSLRLRGDDERVRALQPDYVIADLRQLIA